MYVFIFMVGGGVGVWLVCLHTLCTAGKDDQFQLISCGADKSIIFRSLDKVCSTTHTDTYVECT